MNNKQGNLIFEFKGRTEVIKHDLPFALLHYLKKRLQKDAQYAGGILKVVANYKKEVKKKEITISKISTQVTCNYQQKMRRKKPRKYHHKYHQPFPQIQYEE